jgi:4-amino-4-deoxy-L-arabinose transferase-like glycosyltransferase
LDEGQRTNDSFATWLALIAATSIGIIVFSRGASFDIILTFPMTAALVGFFIFNRSDSASPRLTFSASLAAFYFFTGVALIAKGLIGIIFPFGIVAFYYVLSFRFPPKKFLQSLLWGLPLILLVAATWYWPMYERNGYKFIDEFIIQHHFQRFTSNKYQHPQPFYFFFWVLPLMTIPWLPFFFVAIWKFIKAIFKRRAVERDEKNTFFLSHFLPVSSSPLLRFAFAWLLVPLVFFSFSGSKLPSYILPALPAAIIITADYVYKFVRSDAIRRRWMLGLAAATLIVIIVLLQFFVQSFADTDSVRSLIAAADTRGYSNERVLSLQMVSHNAEFYAAGRIPRTEDGKQRRFSSSNEIFQNIRNMGGTPVLVLTPLKYVDELTNNPDLKADVIADNTELAIVQVSIR